MLPADAPTVSGCCRHIFETPQEREREIVWLFIRQHNYIKEKVTTYFLFPYFFPTFLVLSFLHVCSACLSETAFCFCCCYQPLDNLYFARKYYWSCDDDDDDDDCYWYKLLVNAGKWVGMYTRYMNDHHHLQKIFLHPTKYFFASVFFSFSQKMVHALLGIWSGPFGKSTFFFQGKKISIFFLFNEPDTTKKKLPACIYCSAVSGEVDKDELVKGGSELIWFMNFVFLLILLQKKPVWKKKLSQVNFKCMESTLVK